MLVFRMRSSLVAVLTLMVVSVTAVACSKNAAPPSSAPVIAAPAAAPDPKMDPLYIADDLPRLPPGAPNAPRPYGLVKAAYEFAARHPEVIGYMPCFCGCERGGHKSNESCFIAGRDRGTVQWDTHALGCEICLDVAIETMQMHAAGATVAQIRDVIEKKYAPLYDGHTPTPPAPRGKGHHD
jgi:hypothetical protein